MKNLVKDFLQKIITVSRRNSQISQTREIKIASDSLTCPYCASENAVSLYNLGHSLEESCIIINQQSFGSAQDCAELVEAQKTRLSASFLTEYNANALRSDLSTDIVSQNNNNVNYVPALSKTNVDPTGIEPANSDSSNQNVHQHRAHTNSLSQNQTISAISASTLANWYTQFLPMMPFSRMRDYAMKKYSPKDMVVTATLAHRQLYRYRFHRAKCNLMIAEEYKHRHFIPLKEFLEMVPGECPHQYFQEGSRASETPLTFSKTAMIVRGKTNFATKTAAFILQSVKERTGRHEAIQKFMLYNDSVTVATAHSLRFADQTKAVQTLEEVMLDCNLLIVYLEQYRDIENSGTESKDKGNTGTGTIETEFFEEQIRILLTTRFKVMHLQMSWKKFGKEKEFEK